MELGAGGGEQPPELGPPRLETSFPFFIRPAAEMVTAVAKGNLLPWASRRGTGKDERCWRDLNRSFPNVSEVPGTREKQEEFCTKPLRVPACKRQTL